MRMTQASARERFALARVARLATVSPAGAPHLVPITFAVIEPVMIEPVMTGPVMIEPVMIGPASIETQPAAAAIIAFAVDHKPKTTTALRRLENIAANPRVTFLVDSYDEDWENLWWVRADADAAILDGELKRRALTALATKYVQYEMIPPNDVVVGAVVTGWTGWQYSTNSTRL